MLFSRLNAVRRTGSVRPGMRFHHANKSNVGAVAYVGLTGTGCLEIDLIFELPLDRMVAGRPGQAAQIACFDLELAGQKPEFNFTADNWTDLVLLLRAGLEIIHRPKGAKCLDTGVKVVRKFVMCPNAIFEADTMVTPSAQFTFENEVEACHGRTHALFEQGTEFQLVRPSAIPLHILRENAEVDKMRAISNNLENVLPFGANKFRPVAGRAVLPIAANFRVPEIRQAISDTKLVSGIVIERSLIVFGDKASVLELNDTLLDMRRIELGSRLRTGSHKDPREKNRHSGHRRVCFASHLYPPSCQLARPEPQALYA